MKLVCNKKKYCIKNSQPLVQIFLSFQQKKVFNDVGRGILDNAWKGFNATLFAYGQTGSGKSWSVIGYGPNKGIVPILCEELFKGINENQNKEASSYEVKFSMLEIYNEVARDLLDAKNNHKKKQSGLRIRQHPKKGFYGKFLHFICCFLQVQPLKKGSTNNQISTYIHTTYDSRVNFDLKIVPLKCCRAFENQTYYPGGYSFP